MGIGTLLVLGEEWSLEKIGNIVLHNREGEGGRQARELLYEHDIPYEPGIPGLVDRYGEKKPVLEVGYGDKHFSFKGIQEIGRATKKLVETGYPRSRS